MDGREVAKGIGWMVAVVVTRADCGNGEAEEIESCIACECKSEERTAKSEGSAVPQITR